MNVDNLNHNVPVGRANPAATPLRVLILEDNPSDADLMVDTLRRAGFDPQWERVESESEFMARLGSERDLILSDYALPQFNGVEALKLVRSRGLEVPFILVSGSIGEDIAVEAMRHGADDYLLKDRMARLGPAVKQVLEKRRLRTESERAELARRESEERFRQMAENIHEVFYLTNATGTEILYVSPAYERVWGRKREQLYAKPDAWIDAIHPDDQPRVLEKFKTGLGIGQFDIEYRVVPPDGSMHWIHDRGFPVHDENGNLHRIAGIAEDITERKLAEEKVGRLNRVYAVLSGINTTIVRVRDRQALLNEACRIAVEHGQFPFAWIGVLDPATQDVTPVAWAGQHAEELIRGRSSARDDDPRGKGAVGRAIRERRPVFNNDLTAQGTGGPRLKEILRLGFRSQLTLPLFEDQIVIGTLTMYAVEPSFFDEEELKLLTELAGDISFALENISRQQKLEKLARIRAVSSEINAAIVRIHDREALLRETCRIAAEHGKFGMVWIALLDAAKQEVRPVAWAGFSPEAAHALNWATIDAARGTLGEAMRTRKPAVRNDIEAELPVGKLRQEAVEQGCLSTVGLPLMVDDEVVAAIVLFAAGRGFFDEDELGLLGEVVADISFALQAIKRHEKLEYLSYYDVLTGLPNRTLFVDRLSQQMRSRSGEPQMVALILLDIERFRNINESLGHRGGDEILNFVARRLERAFHGKDYLARISSNGFGAIVRGMTDTVDIVHIVENDIFACFGKPFTVSGREVQVVAKAGIALFPADGGDAETLFRNAESALKRTKASSDRYLFYAAEMNAQAAHAMHFETRLRKAVDAQQFVLHYQPKIELATGRICGLEALIRWNDPETGLVPPGSFIPLLEETGLILEVGRWVLEQALADFRDWTSRGCLAPRVAVNVSAIQLQQKNFTDVVARVVEQAGGLSQALELEITESLLMKDVQASIAKLALLRKSGIHIAVDDFGTGYSSLSYLARLPINTLKIDRSFVSGMAAGADAMAIVSTIIALTHSLNLRVVAEGVETEEQAQMLRLLRCDEAQGYLFSKPLPADEIEPLLRAPAPGMRAGNTPRVIPA